MKITNKEKETKREYFGVVYGSVLGLIPPHMQRKEKLSIVEMVEGLFVVQELKSRKKIRKFTRLIIIRVHTIRVKKIKVEKVGQPHSFIFAYIGFIGNHDEIWLVDSGASRHMTGKCDYQSKLLENIFFQKVDLGDNGKYEVKGNGMSSFQLESRGDVSINNILYVHGSKKNLLSISSPEDQGYRVAFVDGKFNAYYPV